MLKKLFAAARQFWPAGILVVIALVSGLLQLLHLKFIADLLLALTAVGFAVIPLVDSWRAWQSGVLRIDILLPITVLAALWARQFWIAFGAAVVYYLSRQLATALYQRAGKHQQLPLHELPNMVPVIRGRKVLSTAVAEVHTNDKLLCEAGTIVPVDGVVLEGSASCDEQLIGGDSTPVTKMVGDTILSGSRLVDGTLTIKVQQAAADSYLQTVARIVSQAVGEQTPLVRSSDRFSLYVTLSALVLAAGGWYLGDLRRLVAVLVVATISPVLLPAKGILKVALTNAARHGIVFRSGAAVQSLAQAATMVFSFSGIITDGQPLLQSITARKPYTKNEILGLAASLEQASDHPLARAVVAAANEQGFNFIKAKHVQHLPGQGLKATLQGKEILVGNAALLIEHGVPVDLKVPARQLAVYVASNGQLAGIIGFNAAARASARQTLQTLRRRGIQSLQIISSSAQPAVESVADSLQRVTIHAEAPVAEKLTLLAAARPRPVVFVGQAASDDSLLTAADVGIALGEVNPRASHGSGITIAHSDIAYVATAQALVRRAFNQSKQAILAGTLVTLGLMILALSGNLPLLLGLGLQLVINCLMALYPLVRSQKAQ